MDILSICGNISVVSDFQKWKVKILSRSKAHVKLLLDDSQLGYRNTVRERQYHITYQSIYRHIPCDIVSIQRQYSCLKQRWQINLERHVEISSRDVVGDVESRDISE